MNRQRVRAAGTAGPAGAPLVGVLLVGVLLAATGCTGLIVPAGPAMTPAATPASATPPTPPPPQPSSSPGAGGPTDQGPVTASSAGDDLGSVVATRTITVSTTVYDDDTNPSYADPATIRIYPLKRQGSVTQLNFSISLDPSAHADWDSGQELSTQGFADASIDNVALIDPGNARVYYPGFDQVNESCLCSGRIDLQPGATVLATAAFAAPPPDVSTMTVTIPLFGSFGDVPIA